MLVVHRAYVRDRGLSSWPPSRLQVAQDREHPAVVTLGHLEAQLEEDVRHVLLHRTSADDEQVGDRGIRSPLRHEGEHLALPGAEGGAEGAGAAAGPE